MANIKGASGAAPGAYTDVETLTTGVSIPGGTRLAVIMGEGTRSEVLVSGALGGGLDGLNAGYTSASGADGRHFLLGITSLIANRTTVYRNGIPLVGLEEAIDSNTFDNAYDYRVDVNTGKIELQTAYLVDQGGKFYSASTTNYGSGTIENLTIDDVNAPSETWTIKCSSVQRDGYGVPIVNTAKFLSFGSVSGTPLDGYGNPVVWLSDDEIVTNGVISFSILQNPLMGATTLREGDSFTVKVRSGVLLKNDTLTATYIGTLDLNDPGFFDNMEDVAIRFGSPSTDNNLSLGGQLAFSNQPPGIVCLQTKPALPRRTSYDLDNEVKATSDDVEDYIFPLPVGVSPDADSSINFFVTSPTTGIETQIIPNKHAFNTITDTSTTPTLSTFIFSGSTYSYFYTVMQRAQVTKSGSNGAMDAGLAIPGVGTFSSSSFTFTANDIGKELKLFDATNAVNIGTFDITAAVNGALTVSFPLFTSETGVTFEVRDIGTDNLVFTAADGIIAPDGIDGTKCTLTSASANFSTYGVLSNRYVSITTAVNAVNDGTFLISAGVSNTQAVLKKYFVDETVLDFQVVDPDEVGSFVVVNQAVVPDLNSLRVSFVDARDADFYDVGWLEALAALETVDVDIVVPLPKQTISAIFQNTLSHCRTMSNIRNRRERVLFTGAIAGLLPEFVLGNKTAAVEDIGLFEGIQGDSVAEVLSGNTEDLANYSVVDAFGTTFRCVYFYPDEIVVSAGGANVALDGFYMAAAGAGYLSGIPNIAVPLTNKVLSGFTILNTKRFSPTVIERLIAAGITVVQPVSGGGIVIQGKTTTQSGFPEEEEISIIFIRDRIAKSLRQGFAGFIGLPEDATLLSSLTSRAVGLLESFISQGLITAYDSLSVARDSVDPRQWNVKVKVQPTYPVNWIYIKVNVGLI